MSQQSSAPPADFLVRHNDPSAWMTLATGLSTAQDASMTDATPDEEAPSPDILQRLDKQAEALLSIIGDWQGSEIGKLGDDAKIQKLKEDLLDKKNRTSKKMEVIISELDTFVQKVFDGQQQILQWAVETCDMCKEVKVLPSVKTDMESIVEIQKEVELVLSKVLTSIRDATMMDGKPLAHKSDDQTSSVDDDYGFKAQVKRLETVIKGVEGLHMQPPQTIRLSSKGQEVSRK
ncbi:hypothetical protein KC338_g3779 [Hortaea werneckii]|nr:hypothetical protein KC323_g4240 [Hortaea werneckii]KAI6868866.1 hypothetical protein KC338_g3779 [Hortaea werneckii]